VNINKNRKGFVLFFLIELIKPNKKRGNNSIGKGSIPGGVNIDPSPA